MSNGTANPFFISGRVPITKFISQQVLKRVVHFIVADNENSVWITGASRAGKSSLLRYLYAPENQESLYGSISNRLILSRIDMANQSPETCTPEVFWAEVFSAFEECFFESKSRPELYQQYQHCQSTGFGIRDLEKLLKNLNDAELRLVVLIDNFSLVDKLPLLRKPDFFGGLRGLLENCDALRFVVASNYGKVHLSRALMDISSGSNFFTPYNEVRLEPFDKEESYRLLALGAERFSDEDINQILDLTGGHPFLLQAAAYIMWNVYEDTSINDASKRYDDVKLKLHEEHHDFFDDIWNMCTQISACEALACIALTNEQNLLGGFKVMPPDYFTNEIMLFAEELGHLSNRGLLLTEESYPSGWRIGQPILLTWLAEELTKSLRNTEDEFGCWLSGGLVSVAAPPKRGENAMNYHDVELTISSDQRIRISSDDGDRSGELSLDMTEIDLALQLIEKRQTDIDLLKGVGLKLFNAIFPDDIRGQLEASMARADEKGDGIRLRLTFDELLPDLAALPWEFLFDKSRNTFLANDKQTVLSRYIDVPSRRREIAPASLPLRILVVISEAVDLPALDTKQEEALIRSALDKHIQAGQIELSVLREATLRNINRNLQENPPNIVHFIGHGEFKEDQGFVALVDEDGKARLVDDEHFAALFLGNRTVGLIVMNACQGAEVSTNQVFAGVAPQLVQRGIPRSLLCSTPYWTPLPNFLPMSSIVILLRASQLIQQSRVRAI